MLFVYLTYYTDRCPFYCRLMSDISHIIVIELLRLVQDEMEATGSIIVDKPINKISQLHSIKALMATEIKIRARL